MMGLVCCITGGGDQEKTTCLCPAIVSNIFGVPDGAACGMSIQNILSTFQGYRSLIHLIFEFSIIIFRNELLLTVKEKRSLSYN